MNYQKIYLALMFKARKRDEILGYTEIHHILPKSFGGDNSDENLVKLSGREHFIAHRLLAKIYPNSGMVHAIFKMACVNINGKYSKINSRTYDYLKEQHSIRVSNNIEANKKKSESLTGRKQTQEHIDKRTESRKNNGKPWSSDDTIKKMINSLTGKQYGSREITESMILGYIKGVETRKKNGSYKRTPEQIEASASKQRGVPKNIIFTEERLKKLSEDKSKKIVCPYCLKEGQIMVMKRWHFNNCKENPDNRWVNN